MPKSRKFEKVVLVYLIFSLAMTAWLTYHTYQELKGGS